MSLGHVLAGKQLPLLMDEILERPKASAEKEILEDSLADKIREYCEERLRSAFGEFCRNPAIVRMFMDWEERYRENDEKPEVEYQIFADIVMTLYGSRNNESLFFQRKPLRETSRWPLKKRARLPHKAGPIYN